MTLSLNLEMELRQTVRAHHQRGYHHHVKLMNKQNNIGQYTQLNIFKTNNLRFLTQYLTRRALMMRTETNILTFSLLLFFSLNFFVGEK